MKRNILLLSLILSLFTSCLDERNESYTTMDNYFKTTGEIETGLNGCYNSLRTIYQARNFWYMTEVSCDLMTLGGKINYDAICDVTPARPGCGSIVWKNGYIGVKNTNEMTYAIQAAVDGKHITEAEAAPLFAEAAVLRAMYYYLLTSTFGDVPFYTERVTEDNRQKIATLPRMDAKATRDYCIDELKEYLITRRALPMTRTYTGENYRAGAAVGLMVAAKLCMWNERWEDAIEFISVLEDIYGAGKDYAADPEQFKADYPLTDVPFENRYVNESIFEMANSVKLQTTSMIASACIPTKYDPLSGSDSSSEGDGESSEDTSGSDCYAGIRIPELGTLARTSSTVRPTSYLYSTLLPYDSKDLRSGEYSADSDTRRGGSGTLAWRWLGYEANDAAHTGSESVRFFWTSKDSKKELAKDKAPWMGNKFWAYGMNDTKEPNNYKIFRFADALLMKAEAYARKTDPDYFMACAYLSITRHRAGLDRLTYSDLDSESEVLMEEIRKERARELVGEFQRKFDLVRWGIWYTRTIQYNTSTELNNYIRPCHRYWPIPADQVAYSGNALDNNEYLE